MMRTQRGFTLLELIVVIAIFGVMSAMAYGGLNSVLKTRTHVEQSLGRTADLQKAYMRLRNDFQEVRSRPARDAFGDLKFAFFSDRDARLEFSRAGWRNPLGLSRASLERVIYHYDSDKKALIRSSYRVLDQAQDSKLADQLLLENIDDVQWRYLDAARDWVSEWPARNSTGISAASLPPPLAVELTMRMKDIGELRYLFKLGLDQLPKGFVPGAMQAAGAQTPAPSTTTAPAASPSSPPAISP